jgi:hypothetical protein
LNKANRKAAAILFAVLSLCYLGSVDAMSDSWSKNGVVMSGNHSYSWYEPLGKSIQGSSAAHTPPSNGPIDYIFVEVKLEDRCKNANGTWQAYHQFAYNVRAANNATSSGIASAQGTYQDCIYGHSYRTSSRHVFIEQAFSVNEQHSLTELN